MTKQEFLDGKEFVFKGANYRVEEKGRYISKVHRASDGKKLMVSIEGNIDNITDTSCTVYTYMMGNLAEQELIYEDLKPYTPLKDQVEGRVCPICGDELKDCGTC